MKIYGVAILAGCYLFGQLTGDLLGMVLTIQGNIGGVGFGMLLLILVNDWMNKRNYLTTEPEKGILFWSAMYIPVVVAMSSIQNVKAALTGGWTAVIIGLIGTGICFLLVPLVSGLAKNQDSGYK